MKRDGLGLHLETPDYVRELAKEMRKYPTKAEEVLWEHLRKNLLDFKFYRQYPIGRFIADFCCPEKKLIVELDGGIHDEEKRIEYDKMREELLHCYGMKVCRFKNEQVFDTIDNVEEIFHSLISKCAAKGPEQIAGH